MSINTVLGNISKEALGIILPHEHIFINLAHELTEPADPEKRRLSREPITLANYGALRRNPYALKDNVILDDLETAVQELNDYKAAGGATIVDCTSIAVDGIHPEIL